MLCGMLILVPYVFFSLLVGFLAAILTSRSLLGWTLISLLLTPIIALLILAIAGKRGPQRVIVVERRRRKRRRRRF